MPVLSRFTLTPVGVPVALAGGAFLRLFADLLPSRLGAGFRHADPRAHAAAAQMGVSIMPSAVVLAVAAFATPLGYQTHLMVYGAGGYRFSDYVRIGVPLDAIAMIVTVTLTPVFFPFR